MAQMRYFGVMLDANASKSGRTDARYGQFAAIAEPMPVGTTIELDGAPHVVTRVDEGEQPGFWLWAEGMAQRELDDGPTAPNAAPIAVDEEKTAAMGAVPKAVAEDTSAGKPDDGNKRKRRRAKTTIGR